MRRITVSTLDNNSIDWKQIEDQLRKSFNRLAVLPILTNSANIDLMLEGSLASRIATDRGYTVHNISEILSTHLMPVPKAQRPISVTEKLRRICAGNSIFIWCRLSLLFLPELEINVFKLLLDISRSHTIIAFLNCQYNHQKIWYGKKGHPEYQEYSIKDIYIIRQSLGPIG